MSRLLRLSRPHAFWNPYHTVARPASNYTLKMSNAASSRSLSSMQAANPLKKAFLENRGPSVGAWQTLPGVNLSRALAGTGVDFIMLDCEHGNIDDGAMHDSVPAIAALGVSPLVRVPDMQSWMIKRALDCGAHGILVPLIRTVDEVKDVVASAKFPPEGRRGFGSLFATQGFSPRPDSTQYLQEANGSLLTMVQIETREALDAVEEIAPLVDVVFVGPFDLGNNIGYPVLHGNMAPELSEAIARVQKAARQAGKKSGIFAVNGVQAKTFADMGFDMISAATDTPALQASVRENLATARGQGKPKQSGSLY